MITILNLKRDSNKLESITKNLIKYNIKYNIFVGIDAFDYNYTPDELSYLKNVNYDIYKKRGVSCCLLSHLKILMQFINSGLEHVIVAEDNIQITTNNIHTIIHDIKKTSFGIIFLCCFKKPPDGKLNMKINNEFSLYNLKNPLIDINKTPNEYYWYEQGTRLYIMSRSGAIELLKAYYNYNFKSAIDWAMIDHISNSLIIYPSLCSYSNINSSINKRGGH